MDETAPGRLIHLHSTLTGVVQVFFCFFPTGEM